MLMLAYLSSSLRKPGTGRHALRTRLSCEESSNAAWTTWMVWKIMCTNGGDWTLARCSVGYARRQASSHNLANGSAETARTRKFLQAECKVLCSHCLLTCLAFSGPKGAQERGLRSDESIRVPMLLAEHRRNRGFVIHEFTYGIRYPNK